MRGGPAIFIERVVSRVAAYFKGAIPSPPQAYEAAAKAYRKQFPSGDFVSCCFRPHFDGSLVNLFCEIPACEGAVLTRAVAIKRLLQMADWLRIHAHLFGPGDRIQWVVGFSEATKKPDRRIFKCWLPVAALPELHGIDFMAAGGAFREMDGWQFDVNWPGAASEELLADKS